MDVNAADGCPCDDQAGTGMRISHRNDENLCLKKKAPAAFCISDGSFETDDGSNLNLS